MSGRLDRFVGVPFLDGGRTLAAADCWGLVRLFLQEECGAAGLADHGETPAADLLGVARDVAGAAASPAWIGVLRPALRRGDVAVMTARARVDGRPRAVPGHLGVMIDARRLLHVEEHTQSVIVPLDHASVRHRLRTFFRHRSLAS